MERDFLGLNSAAAAAAAEPPMVAVKEEIIDVTNDSGLFAKSPGMQWPFMNKVVPSSSSLPYFMSFKATTNSHEDKQRRVVASVDAFDHTLKRPMGGEVQKTTTTFNFNTIHHRPQLPVSNISMSNPFFKNFASSSTTTVAKTQLVGGIGIPALPTLPAAAAAAAGSVAGFTELWNNSKASSSPAQLTIFFAGTVNVYNDISPEKAQAIMYLASNAIHQRSQIQLPNPNRDGVGLNHKMNGSNLSSPISVSSHTGAQSSGSGSNSNNELLQGKTTGVPVVPVTPAVTTRVDTLRPVTAANMMQSAVPQARKASLARFLEKRKERVTNTAAPYELSKKSPECATSLTVNVSISSGFSCGNR